MATHTVATSTTYVDASGYNPGDIIELAPGTRGSLTIENINGTFGNPIIVQNGDGISVLDDDSGWVGYWLTNCHYVHFTGLAHGQYYGIQVAHAVQFGILGQQTTDNIEIDHIEFLRITGGTTPMCVHVLTTATNGIHRGTYTLSNVKVHHCLADGGLGVNDIGMFCYIGNSNYLEDTNEPDSSNIEVYNNHIENTLYKMIQVGSVISGLKVHDNTCFRGCQGGTEAHAIIINPGIGGEIYNNWVQDINGAGIYSQTAGGKFYNNTIIDCGRNSGSYGSGIVISYKTGYSHSQNTQVLNNTIIRPLHYGVNFVDSYGTQTCQNNIIVAPGTDYISGGDVVDHNLETMDIDDCVFVNYAIDDYNLDVGSPSIDAGADVSGFGITFDANNDTRPVDAYDQGAYEYQSGAPPPSPTASAYGPSAWMIG